jgi:acetolactate synthase-1/2/3 large subunit
VDNDHPNYAGDLGVGMNPALGKRLSQADAVLLLGAELNDITTQDFTLIDPAGPPAIVQVGPDPDGSSRVYPARLAITARPSDMLCAPSRSPPDPWPGRGAEAARADYEAWQVPQETPGDVKLEQVIQWLRDNAGPDTILTNGAGNYAAFLHRYHRFRGVARRSLRPRAPWVTACPPPWPRSSAAPRKRWSASPGTAVCR